MDAMSELIELLNQLIEHNKDYADEIAGKDHSPRGAVRGTRDGSIGALIF